MVQDLEALSRALDPSPAEFQDWLRILECHSEKILSEARTGKAVTPGTSEPSSDFSENGLGFDSASTDFVKRMLGPGLVTNSSRYFGYIPGGGVSAAAFGDFMASLSNRYSGHFSASHGATGIENEVIQLFLKELGMPQSAWGTLISGGSLATVVALLAARETRPWKEWEKSVIYMSSQCHLAIPKALKTIGLGHVTLRSIDVDANFKMDGMQLVEQIENDLSEGLSPWIVCANFGSTNTGSLDPLDFLLAAKEKYRLWLHVDAAYGGFFGWVKSFKPKAALLASADSVILDPHKGLFMPYGVGAVLVRDGAILKKANSFGASYLADLGDHDRNPADYSPELTRHFRGARMYVAMKTHGLGAFRAALEEKLLLARSAYEKLKSNPKLEFACEPELSVIAFRVNANSDEPTEKLLKRVVSRGEVLISSTKLNGKMYLRMCVLCFRSHAAEVDQCVAEINAAVASLRSQ